ncbi:MAG: tetratricopeptide repeat protein [Candidatus Kerfeldbacteria bacterium]|nr:tetratricopeptide repeat protein [Candidatus Kerfeldbacteria bacterium]
MAVAILATAALLAIVVIVARRFPSLAAIDTSIIPAERQDELKARLIEERLRRRAARLGRAVNARLKPMLASFQASVRRRYHQLLELEQRYRARATTGPETREEQVKAAATVESRLAEATQAWHDGNLTTAEQRAIEAIRINPHSVAAYRLLANIYLEQKEYEQARQTLEFIMERLHVADDELYAELGLAAAGEGKLEEAKRDFEQSIKLKSTVAEHYLELCRVHLMLGDSASAFESCRTAVELEPKNPKYLDALVEASIISGKREWAKETLEKLRSVNPENQKLEALAARVEGMPKTRTRHRA